MILRQFVKFAVVGITSNGILYLLYLMLTYSGIGPKVSMSFLYIVGVLQTFLFNKKWTFASVGKSTQELFKYIAVYGSGYIINLLVLMVLVDKLSFPHEIVQGFTIIFLAVYLFLVQRFWVFKSI